MALAASGIISLGGSTAGRSVNLELKKAATAVCSLNDTAVRTLAKKPSGIISLHDLHGKSNIPTGQTNVFTFVAYPNGNYPVAGNGHGSISPPWKMTNGVYAPGFSFSYYLPSGDFLILMSGKQARGMLHNHLYCDGDIVDNASMAHHQIDVYGSWFTEWRLASPPGKFRFTIGQAASIISYQ